MKKQTGTAVAKIEAGSAGNSNISEQLLRALSEVQGTGKSSVVKGKPIKAAAKKLVVSKKATIVRKPVAAISDLTFKVGVDVTSVDVVALQKEAKERSEQLFGSAAEYHTNNLMIKELQSISKIELTSRGTELEKRIEQKNQFDARLLKQSQGVQAQFKVDLFIVRIDKTMPTVDKDVIAIFDEIEAMGRGYKSADFAEINKIQRENRLFFVADNGDKHHLLHNLSQMPSREGKVSGADLRIFAAVRKMIWRLARHQEALKQLVEENDKKQIEEIRLQIGADTRNFMRKTPGMYIFHLPGKSIGDKQVGMAGSVKVEIYQWVDAERKTKTGLRILEGAGCLKPRWEKHPKFGWNLAFWWLEMFSAQGQFPETIPAEIRGSVESFLRKLNVSIIQANKAARWSETHQQSDHVETAPELEHAGVAAV